MVCVLAEETRLGFTHNRRSILLDPALREIVDPAEQNCNDWAHNILQGIFQHTLWLLLCAVKPYGIAPANINDYLQLWTWPRRVDGVTGKHMFSAKRVKSDRDAKTVKCTMTEALSVMPVLGHCEDGRLAHSC